MVSWHDAMDFAKYMNWFGKRRYRLPTEAEWEYAARGGKPWARYWGMARKMRASMPTCWDLDAKAAYGKQVGSWFDCPDGYVQTAPVDDGKRKPNDCGLYDMMGMCGSGLAPPIRKNTMDRRRLVPKWRIVAPTGSSGAGAGSMALPSFVPPTATGTFRATGTSTWGCASRGLALNTFTLLPFGGFCCCHWM